MSPTQTHPTTPFINRSVTIMLLAPLLSLIIGLFTREYSKPYLAGFNFLEQQAALSTLALGHGHTIMVFALMPLLLAAAVYWLRDKLNPASMRWLNLWQYLYLGFGFITIALLIYKGAAILPLFADLKDLQLADQALFGGSHAVRAALYGLAHPVMALALGGMVLQLLQTIGQPDSSTPTP